MTHFNRFAVIMAGLIATQAYAEEPQAPVPFSVNKCVEDAVREVRKNRREYDEKNKKVLAETKQALESELDRLTKEGKDRLDQAIVTREVIRDLNTTVLGRVEAAPPAGNEPALEEWVVGRWSGVNIPHIFEFSKNQEFEGKGKTPEAKHWHGKWQCIRHAFIDVDVVNGGRWEVQRCGPNKMAVVGYNAQSEQTGTGFVLFRQLDPVDNK